ncbi:MAG: ABC transporter ATP-binding protein [Algoriphagus sp.]|jgi:iron complex transport system ATP-binding protein|uniref:ABC transporter ATP-binding protein n=1 Tax=Algoriphagus sp. TaxID=1872435 RepID=UPI00276CC441|nr:ABC transporter ATP-binding protein [Algoriphagus sp.]MDP4956899.1 ABC transporter ATP-binding protein [Algoriphagus sp.]MDP5124403.1 ABC transporter ATP-binding protein [Algoriphagus sp.]
MKQNQIALEGIGLQLGYSQDGVRKPLLENLNFELVAGELTCLLGPNGVGKSTLIKAILGEISPWEGRLLLEQAPLSSYSIPDRAKHIAVVLTDPIYPGNLTVGQLVALGRTPHTNWLGKLSDKDQFLIEKALADTHIGYLRDARLGELSDGQRQKAMIARALAQDGSVIVLDEPTAHLDLVNRLEIMSLLREISRSQGKAILVVTHDLDIALETADRFWILNCGIPLLSGTPEDLVLSGQIQVLFPSDRYRFNVARGRVEWSQAMPDFQIEGPAEQAYWVKKALVKAGITSLDQAVVITAPFGVRVGEESFGSIEDFIVTQKLQI